MSVEKIDFTSEDEEKKKEEDEENNKEEQLPGFHAWEEKQYQKEETEQAMETMLRESGFYSPKDEPETKLPEFVAWEKEQYQKEETENTLEAIRNAIEGKRDKILFENNFYNLPEKEQEKTMNNLGKESNNICSWIENLKESLGGASPEEQEKINKKIEFLKTKRGDVLFELQAYHLALGKNVQKEGINLITKKIEKIKEEEEKEKKPEAVSRLKKFVEKHPGLKGGLTSFGLSLFAVFILIFLKAFEKLTGEKLENKKEHKK